MAISPLILVIIPVTLAIVEAKLKEPICLTGNFHKQKPGPEGSDYKQCFQFNSSSCCTAGFTKQLAITPLKKIGNFSWLQCSQKQLSTNCEGYMKKVECFYQCSPNVGYWKASDKGSFSKVPVCSTFCDKWFDACKSDETCAKNWVTGFNMTADGKNECNINAKCQTFTQVYQNGKGLCEGMWGTSFTYKKSTQADDCMQLEFTDTNPNTKVVNKLFGVSDGEKVTQTFGCILTLFVMSLFACLN